VTISLVAINVIAFLASRDGSPQVLVHWGLIPYNVAHFGKVGELFTSPFLHLSWLHIGLNMLALVSVGWFVEATLGPWRYLVIYAASALGGSVAYYLIAPQLTPGVGASGAIFGLFGAYFVMARRTGVQTTPILIVIGINLVYGFTQTNVGWQAHIGGLVVGTFVAGGFVFAHGYRAPVARGLEAATCLVAAGVLFALMQLHPFGSMPAVPFLPR
jgi:membrane associated rhomboid family serine protease